MKTKYFLFLLGLCAMMFSACYNSNSNKNEPTESNVPVELIDSTVLQSDEQSALEKLNNVIDTVEKEK